MAQFRGFSSQQGLTPAVRTIDAAAPDQMRQELVDVVFSIAERNENQDINSRRIYEVCSQSVGASIAGNPYGGYRYKVGGIMRTLEWQRVYDLIVRLWPEFRTTELREEYRQGINQVLAGHGVVWELDENGLLKRLLPPAAQIQIEGAIQELSQPRFQAALSLFKAALDAYDDRPRRDRDACSNIFDALESVAKVVFDKPNATFGNVLAHIRTIGAMQNEMIDVLERINTLRNHKFGHGMQIPFDLSSAEVDFTYLSCIGGILLFARRQS